MNASMSLASLSVPSPFLLLSVLARMRRRQRTPLTHVCSTPLPKKNPKTAARPARGAQRKLRGWRRGDIGGDDNGRDQTLFFYFFCSCSRSRSARRGEGKQRVSAPREKYHKEPEEDRSQRRNTRESLHSSRNKRPLNFFDLDLSFLSLSLFHQQPQQQQQATVSKEAMLSALSRGKQGSKEAAEGSAPAAVPPLLPDTPLSANAAAPLLPSSLPRPPPLASFTPSGLLVDRLLELSPSFLTPSTRTEYGGDDDSYEGEEEEKAREGKEARARDAGEKGSSPATAGTLLVVPPPRSPSASVAAVVVSAADLSAAIAAAASVRHAASPSASSLRHPSRQRGGFEQNASLVVVAAGLRARLAAAQAAAASLAADRDRLALEAATAGRLRQQRSALAAGAKRLRSSAAAAAVAERAARAEASRLADALRFAAIRESTALEKVRCLQGKLERRDAVLERMHETLLRLGARHAAAGAGSAALRGERDEALAEAEALREKNEVLAAAASAAASSSPPPSSSSPADRILALERSVTVLNARVLAEAEAKQAAAAEADALRAVLAAERAGRRLVSSSVPVSSSAVAEEEQDQGQSSAVAAAEAAAAEAEEAAAAAVDAAAVAAAAAASAADGNVVVTTSAKKLPKRRPVSAAAAAAKHSNDAIDDLSARVAALGALLASSSRND